MDKLITYSIDSIARVDIGFKRYLHRKINWNNRLNIITGARGVGKTTLMLQHIRENLSSRPEEVLYINMDDLYFSNHSLVEFTGEFVKRGGRHLFIDEIHKYPQWSSEIKNIYDYFHDLNINVTGSSALEVFKGEADLSRRAILHKMNGLSFREYIGLKYGIIFPQYPLEQLLQEPAPIIESIKAKIKPIRLFEQYLVSGYYPFFKEGEDEYHVRLKQIINQVLDYDLPSVERIEYEAVYKLRKLLSVLAELVPYKPNILKLSQQIGVSRDTLRRYLALLEKAGLIMLLSTDRYGIGKLNKPDKIYLNNSNLMYALSPLQVNPGTSRETFFYNQLQVSHLVTTSEKSDFEIDQTFTFEVGGKNKGSKQISGISNAYIAADNTEHSYQNRIPLWLFGFLY